MAGTGRRPLGPQGGAVPGVERRGADEGSELALDGWGGGGGEAEAGVVSEAIVGQQQGLRLLLEGCWEAGVGAQLRSGDKEGEAGPR